MCYSSCKMRINNTVDNLIGIVVLYKIKIEESKTLKSINESLLKILIFWILLFGQ